MPATDTLSQQNEDFMTILARLEHWREQGAISPEQHSHLASLCRGEPLSLFLELNVLLYAGVLAFVAGLGWTVTTWSQQLGDVLVLAILSTIIAACFWYCFSRAPAWSLAQTPAPSAVFDYVLCLGSLVWCIELAYLESRFHVLSGQWDFYLLATAVFFFFLAYRFDNRFVLSLALSSLAGWFGLTISHWPSHQDAAYRQYALLYCLLVGLGGVLLQQRGDYAAQDNAVADGGLVATLHHDCWPTAMTGFLARLHLCQSAGSRISRMPFQVGAVRHD